MESSGLQEQLKLPRRETQLSRRAFLCAGGKAAVTVGTTALLPRFRASNVHQGEISQTQLSESLATNEIPPLPEFEYPDPNQKALIIMLREKGAPEPFSKDDVNQMFTEVKTYYDENSYGKIHYDFVNLGWHESENPLDLSLPDRIGDIGDKAISQLEAEGKLPEGVRVQDYQTRIYIVDRAGKTGPAGYGAAREPYNRIWIYQDDFTGGVGVMQHELGHTLGLGHVDFVSFKTPNDFTHVANTVDAGGQSGMGNDYDRQFAGPQKVQLGWIPKDQVQTITANGEYTLSPLQLSTDQMQILRVQKPDTNEFYYIEYSVPVGTDVASDSSLRFYLWDEIGGSNVRQFNIVPFHPATKDGDKFFDSMNGIRIQQIKSNEESVRVQVSLAR